MADGGLRKGGLLGPRGGTLSHDIAEPEAGAMGQERGN